MFGDTFFVSMILDARSMADETFESNEQYITDLPQCENEYVNRWIRDVNQNVNRSAGFYEEIDPKYRSLIGIDKVRRHIQQRWLKEFYQAAPTLKATLNQQLTYANDKYDAILNECRLVDPTLIRESYLSYLNDFRKTLGQYAACLPEINGYFPVKKCGTTYQEVETGFNNWSRRQQLVWRAYLSDAQLKMRASSDDTDGQHLIDHLNLKLVGGSQFGRLHQVFIYMVLSFKPDELTRDEIVTLESYLYGGLSTSPNVEKVMRDTIVRLIRHTFAIGIPWFAQMHTYLIDTFRINVTRLLLSQNRYAHLAKHTSFLRLVELDFHRKMRVMLSKAVQAVRNTRLSCSAYVHYDATAWMKKLTFRIPSEIPHGFYSQNIPNIYVKNTTTTNKTTNQNDTYHEATIGDIFANIKKPHILDFIFGSDSYLTNKRDPRTGSHHDSVRKAVQEIYEVTSGRLTNDIISHFNSNVIVGIVNYNQVEAFSTRSIANKIVRTSDMDIVRMANVEIEKIFENLDYWKQQIADLTQASVLLDAVTQQLVGETSSHDLEIDDLKEYAQRSAQMAIDLLNSQRERISKSFNKTSLTDNQNQNDEKKFEMIDNEDDETYEDRIFFRTIDPITSGSFLRRIYQHHDLEDIRSSLLDGDELDQDTSTPKAEEHIKLNINPTMNESEEPLVQTEISRKDLGNEQEKGNACLSF
ncbi:unnamed protein product [Rotaria sordida]|uniref:Uncharacterized protein n=1 Tax=Rotaria sordida TaxID=392033 RepID=A0A814UY01_9BILA|nr:unnamed protein product [Rotaria sordida]CAF1441194.1 unnamed protein product [Rotaria sordida]